MNLQASSTLHSMSAKKMNEDPEQIEKDLDHIRTWLRNQPHLIARDDDSSLLIFLRSSKYSLQRTKEKLDYYYSVRTIIPEFFENRDPFCPDVQATLNAGSVIPLPKTKNNCGPRIILCSFGYCDPEITTYTTIIKTILMVFDILMIEDLNTVVTGVCMWVDLDNCPLQYALQFTPVYVKKHIYCMEIGYPLRIKGINATNCKPGLDTAFKFVRVILNGKLKERVHIFSCSKFGIFKENFSNDLLPIEYGGNNGSIKELAVEWKKKLESYKDWFVADAKYKSMEELRRGQSKICSEELGIDGSFRQLNID